MRDIMILIPLSGMYYLAFYDGNAPSFIDDGQVNSLSKAQINEINEAIINNSYIKCICNNEESLKSALTKFNYQSPLNVMTIGIRETLKKEVFLYEKDRMAWKLFVKNEWVNYRLLGESDKCECGSGKNYKDCCMRYIETCERMLKDIANEKFDACEVNENATMGKSIAEFFSYKL